MSQKAVTPLEDEEETIVTDPLKPSITELAGEEKNEVGVRNSDQPEAREQWSQKWDFLMSIIGFSVDLAGIWRL